LILIMSEVSDPAAPDLALRHDHRRGPPGDRTDGNAMDWHKWHNVYDENPALQKRLVLVRKHLSRCLDRSAPGEVRIISVCAGDGRDILRTLAGHERLADARARLVELDPTWSRMA
jgi:hypothetical protein